MKHKTLKQEIFSGIWILSETTKIGLGIFAPFVFEQMMGIKRKKTTSHN